MKPAGDDALSAAWKSRWRFSYSDSMISGFFQCQNTYAIT
jgi:hypothetical protein